MAEDEKTHEICEEQKKLMFAKTYYAGSTMLETPSELDRAPVLTGWAGQQRVQTSGQLF